MTKEVFLRLVSWLQENYHCGLVDWQHLENPQHRIGGLTFKITNSLQLSIKANESEDELGLIDYSVSLETPNCIRMTVTSVNFCAFESNAERVIEHIEQMLIQHSMELLPRRMIVYEARDYYYY